MQYNAINDYNSVQKWQWKNQSDNERTIALVLLLLNGTIDFPIFE